MEKDFTDRIPTAHKKAKIDLGFHQIENFCTAKQTINSCLRWEKLIGNRASERDEAKIFKELNSIIKKEQTNMKISNS